MAGSGSDDGDKFLVRGALLKCSCGSHPRRLNLMKDHGVTVDLKDGYDKGHPFVHEMDCVPGPNGNIDYFGVCNMLPKNSPTAISLQAVNEKGELITSREELYQKDLPYYSAKKFLDSLINIIGWLKENNIMKIQ